MRKRELGALAESKATAKLYDLGLTVSTPEFREARYDLVVDSDGDLYRVQVKHGYVSDKGTLRAELRSRNQDGNDKYSEDEVDAFIIYGPQMDNIYWLWQSEVGETGQLSIYTKDWDDLNAGNKATSRYWKEYLVSNRNL